MAALAILLGATSALAQDPEDAMGLERGKYEEPDALVTVEFGFFTWKLTDPVRDQLRAFLANADRTASYEVAGHADAVGPDDQNLTLSQKRADNVRRFLVRRGFPESQLTAVGYGETQPVDSNDTEEGRANNRRVVLKPQR